jgi:pilus assembly protein FimV
MVFDGATLRSKVFRGRRARSVCLFLLVGLWFSCAQALTLGPLNLLSNSDQALSAEILISEATEQELKQLTAKVADQSVHEKAAIRYSSSHAAILVDTITKSSGQSVLVLKSETAMPDSDLDILLQVNWGAGQILKEYRLSLKKAIDPTVVAASSTQGQEKATSTSVSAVRAPITEETGAKPAQEPMPVVLQSALKKESKEDGQADGAAKLLVSLTTKQGDTAYKLIRLIGSESYAATQSQLLLALLQSNPQAFSGNNVNRMRSGVLVDLEKARHEVLVEASLADQEIQVQNALHSRMNEEAARKVGLVSELKSKQSVSSGLVNFKEKVEVKTTQSTDRLELTPAATKPVAEIASGTLPSPAQAPVSSTATPEQNAIAQQPASAPDLALASTPLTSTATASESVVSTPQATATTLEASPVKLSTKKNNDYEQALGWLLTLGFLAAALVLAYYLVSRNQPSLLQERSAQTPKN